MQTDATVTPIGATPIGDVVGFMGEITKFDLAWNMADQQPASVILKVPSIIAENQAPGMTFGVYEGELRMYTELSGYIGLASPRCWFSPGNSTASQYALLTEDLTGHKRIDRLDGTAIPAYEQAHGDILTTDNRSVCHRFVDEFDTVIDVSLDTSLTLLHSGYRIGTMLLDSGSPAVLDWGNVARGRNLCDMAYFLFGTLTIDNRRRRGDQLLTRHTNRLKRKDIPIENPEQRHREAALFRVIVPVMLGGDALDAREEKSVSPGK